MLGCPLCAKSGQSAPLIVALPLIAALAVMLTALVVGNQKSRIPTAIFLPHGRHSPHSAALLAGCIRNKLLRVSGGNLGAPFCRLIGDNLTKGSCHRSYPQTEAEGHYDISFMEIARQYSDALKAISESLQRTVCLKRKPLRKAKTKTEAFRTASDWPAAP